jgi:hypothetical protein
LVLEASPYFSLLPLIFGGDGMENQACSCRADVMVDLEVVLDVEGLMAEKSLA